MLLEAGDSVVLNLDDNILTNQGETIVLMDPNGNAIQTLTWDTSTDCETSNHGMGGRNTTNTVADPRSENPLIHSYDGSMTIKFTRVMPAEASFGRNNDWFEITNTGETWVDLGGWTVARLTSDSTQSSLMVNYILEPGQSIVISENPANLNRGWWTQCSGCKRIVHNDLLGSSTVEALCN